LTLGKNRSDLVADNSVVLAELPLPLAFRNLAIDHSTQRSFGRVPVGPLGRTRVHRHALGLGEQAVRMVDGDIRLPKVTKRPSMIRASRDRAVRERLGDFRQPLCRKLVVDPHQGASAPAGQQANPAFR
jgi:hypothetical protein